MKLAVTADIHLTSRNAHPERYHALENILHQMLADGVNTLIIAGDLFDESSRNYAEFDEFCKTAKHREARFIIVPGNHDAHLTKEFITAENVEICFEPTIRRFGSHGLTFLFLPYRLDKTMGEFIAAKADDLPENDWVLVGHGDWSEGMREPNPSEPGVYMPLTRTDIETYRPAKVILGHIHKPLDKDKVHYVGSPCGLDVTETGRRRFIVLDSETGSLKAAVVEADFIYFNESFVILPLRDESAFMKGQIAARIKQWDLKSHEKPKVRISVRCRGYTSDKTALLNTITEAFQGYRFYKEWEPDLSNVAVSDDLNLAEVANQVRDWIQQLDWQPGPEDPTKEGILLEALHVIYGT